MPKALFLVIRSGGNWWVDFEGAAEGPFPSRENAALEARSLAQLKAHSGRDAEVLVPDEQGRYWVIWSSRQSPDGGAFTPRRVAG